MSSVIRKKLNKHVKNTQKKNTIFIGAGPLGKNWSSVFKLKTCTHGNRMDQYHVYNCELRGEEGLFGPCDGAADVH